MPIIRSLPQFIPTADTYLVGQGNDGTGGRFTVQQLALLSNQHTHDTYALSVHPHPYATLGHNHNGVYDPDPHSHPFAAKIHDHGNSTYAPKIHSHGNATYAPDPHSHGTTYSLEAHDHSDIYSELAHTHAYDPARVADLAYVTTQNVSEATWAKAALDSADVETLLALDTVNHRFQIPTAGVYLLSVEWEVPAATIAVARWDIMSPPLGTLTYDMDTAETQLPGVLWGLYTGYTGGGMCIGDLTFGTGVSTIDLNITVGADAEISFYWKRAGGDGSFRFLVGEVERLNNSGDDTWTQFTGTLPPGSVSLHWQNDHTEGVENTALFLDQVVITKVPGAVLPMPDEADIIGGSRIDRVLSLAEDEVLEVYVRHDDSGQTYDLGSTDPNRLRASLFRLR